MTRACLERRWVRVRVRARARDRVQVRVRARARARVHLRLGLVCDESVPMPSSLRSYSVRTQTKIG